MAILHSYVGSPHGPWLAPPPAAAPGVPAAPALPDAAGAAAAIHRCRGPPRRRLENHEKTGSLWWCHEIYFIVILWDFMEIYGDSMEIYGDVMGFYREFVGFSSGLMED